MFLSGARYSVSSTFGVRMKKAMKTAQEAARRWAAGLRRMPHIPCPACGRKTRAEFHCQYCKVKWSAEQKDEREKIRGVLSQLH